MIAVSACSFNVRPRDAEDPREPLMNLFATVLTYPAPSANYRGESEENRSVIQKITYGRFEYPIISPESIRNALRETLAKLGLPRNRTRLNDEDQLAVRFADYPDPDKYADDFFFGYLVAASGADRKKIQAKLKEAGRDETAFQFKRDSVLRMNLARGVEPYRNNAVFTQSPLTSADSPWQNAKTSALLHRETVLTAFQYPFALNLDDCRGQARVDQGPAQGDRRAERRRRQPRPELLRDGPGQHRRAADQPARRRLRHLRVRRRRATIPEVVDGILDGDDGYPGGEFFLGGKIVKDMEPETSR